jgi:hypothetical protein
MHVTRWMRSSGRREERAGYWLKPTMQFRLEDSREGICHRLAATGKTKTSLVGIDVCSRGLTLGRK